MQKNVLIGIGGTGSRVIESVIHLCAAGLGPDKLSIIIIDPDEANGNLTHTKTLIKQYSDLRKRFKNIAGNDCFKTEIVVPPDDNSFVWNIFNEKDYTLSKYINYNNLTKNEPNLADFAEVLFTEKELQTSLNEGFRGHPSIGAVVMADPPMDEYPFKLLWDDISSLHANDLRVFLVGSIFGGTGAAGFPTLGSRQLIKFNDKLHATLGGGKSRVLLGGALVLPYFSFSVENTEGEPMFVTTDDFPIATKAALQYYNDKELGFDQYYFIGDSLSQKVGEFSTGSSNQENQPHYIEMVSALAAFDFYNPENKVDDIPEKKYFISSREDDVIDWNMIPITRNGEKLHEARKLFKRKLVDFSVFAYTFLTYGQSILGKSHDDVKLETWYAENFKKDYKETSVQANPRLEENMELYKVMDQYLRFFIFWICSVDNGDIVKLIDKEQILAEALDVKHRDKLKFRNPVDFPNNIGYIIKERTNQLNFNSFKTKGLQESLIEDKTMNAGSKFLNIFYEAAKKFNESNLLIN
jgi:hypothetical protein